MSDQNIEKLREEVNPVFATAQSCLQVNAEMGDTDAKKMMELLGIRTEPPKSESEGMTPEMMTFVMQKLRPGFNIMVETRFAASNRLILESRASRVVDLPCGYTPRGIKLSRENIRYFGLDLPAVIDAVAPAVRKIIGENSMISYHAVDATNYTSMHNVLDSSSGDELLITTEGMLMYLTQSEAEEVFHNVHRLLLEFGGKWVTTDNEILPGQNKILALFTDGNAEEMSAVKKLAAGRMSKAAHTENAFFDRDNAEKFVEEMGFQLAKVPMFDYLPQNLHSLDNLPPEKQRAARDVFKEVNFWVMTPKSAVFLDRVCEENDFRTEMKLTDGLLHISVSGRLDTITAPNLLAMYRECTEQENITGIVIDMKDLDYISSAGLRVLLIMKKALSNENQLSLKNMNKVVSEIMETTGFDSIFC